MDSYHFVCCESCCQLTLSKIRLFKRIFQEHYPSVKQFLSIGVSYLIWVKTDCISRQVPASKQIVNSRTLVKSAYRNFNFLITQPNHMLWILKTYGKIDGKENSYNFMLNILFIKTCAIGFNFSFQVWHLLFWSSA